MLIRGGRVKSHIAPLNASVLRFSSGIETRAGFEPARLRFADVTPAVAVS